MRYIVMLMQVSSGILAQLYGTKTVFILCNGLSVLLPVTVTASAKNNYKTLVVSINNN